MRTWIRDPIAMLATGGKRGLVVEDGRITELVEQDGPATACDCIFDARRHVIIPGLVNAHHHFFQTLTRAHPQAINKQLFPWLKQLYPIWGAHLDRHGFRLAVRVALTELLISPAAPPHPIICLYFRTIWPTRSISKRKKPRNWECA
jgi:8-oxoguanine deaminase